MGWKRTATELLHRGPFLSVYRDQVIRPDGSAGAYEHVVTKDSVRVVAFDGDGMVLLAEDDFYLQGRRVLHCPGGGVETGQDARSAGIRELEEETGRRANGMQSLGILDPLPGITGARVHMFLTTDLNPGRMNRDGNEIGMTIQRRTLSQAVSAVRKGEITEAGSVAALLLAGALLGLDFNGTEG